MNIAVINRTVVDTDVIELVMIGGDWLFCQPGTFTLCEFAVSGVAGVGKTVLADRGFRFLDHDGGVISGPLSEIQAVGSSPTA